MLEALRDAAVGGGAVALVLVISVAAPYVAGQAAAVAALIESAGQAVLSHTLLLFTHGDALEADRAFLPNYLDEAPPALQVPFCIIYLVLCFVIYIECIVNSLMQAI